MPFSVRTAEDGSTKVQGGTWLPVPWLGVRAAPAISAACRTGAELSNAHTGSYARSAAIRSHLRSEGVAFDTSIDTRLDCIPRRVV